jgi:hypothetical protein
MWTVVTQVFSTNQAQNGWAFLVQGNAWRKIAPNAADGVTNVFAMLIAAKISGRQAYVVLDGQNQITQVYV